MSITPFPSKSMTPQQALLYAGDEVDDMEYVVIAYMPKGANHARLTVSSCQPIDIHFLGTALQRYAQDWPDE
jgi:hypothetical protein